MERFTARVMKMHNINKDFLNEFNVGGAHSSEVSIKTKLKYPKANRIVEMFRFDELHPRAFRKNFVLLAREALFSAPRCKSLHLSPR